MTKHTKLVTAVILCGALLVAAGLALGLRQPTPVQASAPAQGSGPVSDDTCLACHSGASVADLKDGTLYIGISGDTFKTSVHGQNGIACAACHTDISAFPHPRSAEDLKQIGTREYKALYAETCKSCHADQFAAANDGIHAAAMQAGNLNAPFCTDCHDPHKQMALTNAAGQLSLEAHVAVPQTCAKCHNTIYEEYKDSVHGAGVLQEHNPDVPSCVTCHGVHNISDPTTNAARLASPNLCADCHTNKEIMDKYGLTTAVLDTYVSDFHGATVTLFEKASPDQVTNKPVCYDCHGVHNIAAKDDPVHGLQVKENLLATCVKCHPDVTNANFPDSWMSHYSPSPDRSPLVYYVQLFYFILIPVVLGGMVLYIGTDIFRTIKDRTARNKPVETAKTDDTAQKES